MTKPKLFVPLYISACLGQFSADFPQSWWQEHSSLVRCCKYCSNSSLRALSESQMVIRVVLANTVTLVDSQLVTPTGRLSIKAMNKLAVSVVYIVQKWKLGSLRLRLLYIVWNHNAKNFGLLLTIPTKVIVQANCEEIYSSWNHPPSNASVVERQIFDIHWTQWRETDGDREILSVITVVIWTLEAPIVPMSFQSTVTTKSILKTSSLFWKVSHNCHLKKLEENKALIAGSKQKTALISTVYIFLLKRLATLGHITDVGSLSRFRYKCRK